MYIGNIESREMEAQGVKLQSLTERTGQKYCQLSMSTACMSYVEVI